MIRKATKQDEERILRIWLEASLKAHHFIADEYWQRRLPEIRDVYLPQAETYIFEDKHQIKGFISIILDHFIGALFVDPLYQRQKIGSKLLEYVRQNKSSLTLSVYVKNTAAVRFYQQNQFKIIAEKNDKQTGEDELVFSWSKGCRTGLAKIYPSDS